MRSGSTSAAGCSGGDNPVLLRRVDGRYFANTKALRIARLTGEDGLLERRTGEMVQRLVAPVSLEQKVLGARGVMAELSWLGITSIHDIARHPALSERAIHPCHVERSYSNLAVFQTLRQREHLGVRVYAFLIVGEEKLLERIVAGDRAGFDIGVHVLGDAAIRQALDCFEHAARVNPATSCSARPGRATPSPGGGSWTRASSPTWSRTFPAPSTGRTSRPSIRCGTCTSR